MRARWLRCGRACRPREAGEGRAQEDTTKHGQKPDDQHATRRRRRRPRRPGAAGAPRRRPTPRPRRRPRRAQPAGGGGAGGGAGGCRRRRRPRAASRPTPAAATEPDVDTLRQEYLCAARRAVQVARARERRREPALLDAHPDQADLHDRRATTARRRRRSGSTARRVYEDASRRDRRRRRRAVRRLRRARPPPGDVPRRGDRQGRRHVHVDDRDARSSSRRSPARTSSSRRKAKDSGDIAYEWKRKERGSYGLGIDVAVKTMARPPAARAKAAASARAGASEVALAAMRVLSRPASRRRPADAGKPSRRAAPKAPDDPIAKYFTELEAMKLIDVESGKLETLTTRARRSPRGCCATARSSTPRSRSTRS